MYLIIKAAATLRTLGYLHNAMIVNKLPVRPVIIINIAITAANVLSGLENLWINIVSGFNKIDDLLNYILLLLFMNIKKNKQVCKKKLHCINW